MNYMYSFKVYDMETEKFDPMAMPLDFLAGYYCAQRMKGKNLAFLFACISTGLKIKDQFIYDGDILAVYYDKQSPGCPEYLEVKMHNGCWMLGNRNLQLLNDMIEEWGDDIKVAGHILTHKHLLKNNESISNN